MNTLQLVWKNISQQWASTVLSILLTAFGVAILTSLYITSDSFEKQMDNNSKQVDLVVGAKGSPLQLILSTLYHVDNPTGNIKLSEALSLQENPFIELAVPISLGDNFKGHRIIGTDTSFMGLYDLEIAAGELWGTGFEVVIGSETARKNGLQLGDHIHGAHGLSEGAHVHEDHPFTIVGILEPSGTVVDNLLLTNLESVWDIHGIHHDDDHDHGHDHPHDMGQLHEHESTDQHVHLHGDHPENHDSVTDQEQVEELVAERPVADVFIKNIADDIVRDTSLEITALLVTFSSPAAIGTIPRLINQSTNMQAASPALETARLFSLMGVGIDSLEILAYIIMIIAGLSVFISLYNALKDRKYDLAIMRTLGASKFKLFTMLIVEGLVITLIGGFIGLLLGHIGVYLIGQQTSQSTAILPAFKFYGKEWLILLIACLIGMVSALIPAIKAYRTSISTILGNK